MERKRTTWLLLLVMSLSAMTAVSPAQAPAGSTSAIIVADETPCSCTLKCPCGCSPLAGAWLAKLSSPVETVIQTFKFAPVNEGCTKFVVNSQAATRGARVAKFWPDACDLTEFVGIACKDEWKDIQFTAIGYGVKRCAIPEDRKTVVGTAGDATSGSTTDKVVFIAIMTAKVEIPGSCLECDPWGNDSSGPNSFGMDGTYTGGCLEPKQLKATIYVSYYDAAQDVDRDGLPDCPCEEAVICVCYETCLKRVEPRAPCAESRSFVACLSPCADCNCPGTGRAFFRILEEEQKVCFVLTAKGIRNVRKACLEVSAKPGETGTCAVTLFPFPPETKGKDGDCDGLLSCGCFYLKDCLGPWKGRKMADIVKAMEEGCARVVVFTEECPQGALCGRIEDP